MGIAHFKTLKPYCKLVSCNNDKGENIIGGLTKNLRNKAEGSEGSCLAMDESLLNY